MVKNTCCVALCCDVLWNNVEFEQFSATFYIIYYCKFSRSSTLLSYVILLTVLSACKATPLTPLQLLWALILRGTYNASKQPKTSQIDFVCTLSLTELRSHTGPSKGNCEFFKTTFHCTLVSYSHAHSFSWECVCLAPHQPHAALWLAPKDSSHVCLRYCVETGPVQFTRIQHWLRAGEQWSLSENKRLVMQCWTVSRQTQGWSKEVTWQVLLSFTPVINVAQISCGCCKPHIVVSEKPEKNYQK